MLSHLLQVSVGMELVKDPLCLFLDEATSGLDSEMAASVMDILKALAARGRTVRYSDVVLARLEFTFDAQPR